MFCVYVVWLRGGVWSVGSVDGGWCVLCGVGGGLCVMGVVCWFVGVGEGGFVIM